MRSQRDLPSLHPRANGLVSSKRQKPGSMSATLRIVKIVKAPAECQIDANICISLRPRRQRGCSMMSWSTPAHRGGPSFAGSPRTLFLLISIDDHDSSHVPYDSSASRPVYSSDAPAAGQALLSSDKKPQCAGDVHYAGSGDRLPGMYAILIKV